MNINLTMLQKFLACPLENYKFEVHSDYLLSKNGDKVRDVGSCQWQCKNKAECNYWTYEKSSKKCFMMRANDNLPLVYNDKWISGPKKCMNKLELEEKEVPNASCSVAGLSFNPREGNEKHWWKIQTSKGSCQYEAQKRGGNYYHWGHNKWGWYTCHISSYYRGIESKISNVAIGGMTWCPVSFGIFTFYKIMYLSHFLQPV